MAPPGFQGFNKSAAFPNSSVFEQEGDDNFFDQNVRGPAATAMGTPNKNRWSSLVSGNSMSEMENMPIMNNRRLAKFCRKYKSDNQENIEKRCFFLFSGQDLEGGTAFNCDFRLVMNDFSPTTLFDSAINIENVTCEIAEDIASNISKFLPAFKTLLAYDDLHTNQWKDAALDLERRIQF
jgi:hypothetical protein